MGARERSARKCPKCGGARIIREGIKVKPCPLCGGKGEV